MSRYEVVITDSALNDMETIYSYIAEVLLSPDNAANQYDRIADAILLLDTFPERNRVMDSPREHKMGLRMLPIDNYTVFYCIKGDRVFVTDVLCGRCNYEEKLKGLE
jgi:plasmid stabilization system protein ParE